MAETFTQALNRNPTRPMVWLMVAVCMLVLVCEGVDLQLLGILAPLVTEGLGTDKSTFGFAMGAALVGFGIGSWAGGWMGDTLGRRWTLTIAALIFSVATIGAGTSSTVLEMAAWRVLSGLGFGAAYANALALASEWLSEKWRPVAVSTLAVGTPIGGTVVGWLAPGLASDYGWDGTFLRIGLATLVLVVIIPVVLRDSPSFLLAKGKIKEAKRNAKIALNEDVDLQADNFDGDQSTEQIGVMHRSNLRLNIGISIAFAAATTVAYAILSWSTTFLTERGFTLDEAGGAVAIAGITSLIGSVLAGVAVRQFGSKLVMAFLSISLFFVIIALGWSVGELPASPLVAGASDILLVKVLIGAAGFLFSGSIAAMYVMMALGYPQSCRSAGIGFCIFMSRIGAISSSALGGAVLAWGGASIFPFFTIIAVASLMILAASLVVDRHVPPLAKK